MNENESIITIEDEMVSVIQKLDELLDERVQSGEINTEEYLKLSGKIQTYADESRQIVALLRTELPARASSFHNFFSC
jgi:hypothetical protein